MQGIYLIFSSRILLAAFLHIYSQVQEYCVCDYIGTTSTNPTYLVRALHK